MRLTPLLALAALVACNRGPDDHICTADAVFPGNNAEQLAGKCVQKWARRLASGRDAAPDVAEGVIQACSAEVENTGTPNADGSLQPANWAVWKRQAVFEVVDARAGRCVAAE